MKFSNTTLFQNKIKLVVLLFLFSALGLKAQEKLIYIPRITNSKVKKTTNTLKLPFFDDFSDYTGLAKAELWDTSGVYINNTLAVNPPSAGVATFDAYDAKSKIYSTATANNHFRADYLLSLPIDLGATDTKDVYFSFFYQPQGIGNAPELNDSLVLQFYAPQKQSWQTVWFTLGSKIKDFQYIILPVANTDYLKKGFRFRFYNYCSFLSSTSSSTITNADLWHVDYIYLNKNRTIIDNVFHDISFLSAQTNYLKKYSSVPWQYFLSSQNLLTDSFNVCLRNIDNSGRKLKERFIYWKEEYSGDSVSAYQLGATNIPASSIADYKFKFPLKFKDNGMDSANFKVVNKFITDDYDRKNNNKIIINQKFKDYYAYDDGSSEAAYGILGEGSRNALFAYQFVPLQSGFLNALDIYFNYSLNQAYVKPIYLCLWDSKNGKPSEILYKQEGFKPKFSSSTNQFIRYKLDSSIAIDDTFYVGWIQTTSNSVNIGYDLNNNAAQYTYYNIDGSWRKSALTGSVMMRPVIEDKVSSISKPKQSKAITFYPNPANNFIYLNNPKGNNLIRILDLTGKIVFQTKIPEKTINTANLKNGIYIMQIINNSLLLSTQKLIIQHR